MHFVGGADGAAKRTGGKRRIAFAWGQAADRLHAAQEAERVGIYDQPLLVDNAWKRTRVEEAAGQALQAKRVAPFGKALAADRGEHQLAVRRETLAERGERGFRVGKPMQRHAHGDEAEGSVGCRPRGIHHLEADALLPRAGKIAPALLDHGGREVGEDERSIGVARKEMLAEQPRAAAKLEHAGSSERR